MEQADHNAITPCTLKGNIREVEKDATTTALGLIPGINLRVLMAGTATMAGSFIRVPRVQVVLVVRRTVGLRRTSITSSGGPVAGTTTDLGGMVLLAVLGAAARIAGRTRGPSSVSPLLLMTLGPLANHVNGP